MAKNQVNLESEIHNAEKQQIKGFLNDLPAEQISPVLEANPNVREVQRQTTEIEQRNNEQNNFQYRQSEQTNTNQYRTMNQTPSSVLPSLRQEILSSNAPILQNRSLIQQRSSADQMFMPQNVNTNIGQNTRNQSIQMEEQTPDEKYSSSSLTKRDKRFDKY